jgi:hypothetical protein
MSFFDRCKKNPVSWANEDRTENRVASVPITRITFVTHFLDLLSHCDSSHINSKVLFCVCVVHSSQQSLDIRSIFNQFLTIWDEFDRGEWQTCLRLSRLESP